MLAPEIVPLKRFPYYGVTASGEVWRLEPLRKRSPCWDGHYFNVGMTWGKSKKTVRVHALVAEAFLGQRPVGFNVNHKNGDRTDNRLENLEYVTFSENTKHGFRNGLMAMGEKHWISKLTEADVRRIRGGEFKGLSQSEIGAIFKVSQSLISAVVRNKIWYNVKEQ